LKQVAPNITLVSHSLISNPALGDLDPATKFEIWESRREVNEIQFDEFVSSLGGINSVPGNFV
jgi:hypothetical protein